MRQRRLIGVAAALTLVATTVSPTPSLAAGTVARFGDVDAAGLVGHVGIDVDGAAFGYELVAYWDAAGDLDDVALPGAPPWVRFEFYPDSHAYDPWTLDVGGTHVHRDPSLGSDWSSLGDISLPQLGRTFAGATGFRIDGAIASGSPVADGRIEIDAFQLGIREYDPFIPPLPRNDVGVEMGAFATSTNRGLRWTAGVGWPGRYVLFIRDTATDRHVQAIADLAPGRVPTIDLDAVCFGFHTCQYDRGAPAASAGAFHPLPPTRILDTRARLGIRNGAVRTGGGWSGSDSRVVRHDDVVNHELKVTGRGGVPETGVSAVLLNVVAVHAPGAGYLAVRPRRPSCCSELAIHDDRAAMDPDPPATSNLNVPAEHAVANLVLARVGAGGTINLYNAFGPTHVVADVAGWFDTGPPPSDAVGFLPVDPTRVLDTRDGTGGPRLAFEPGQERTVDLSRVASLRADTSSVVVNLTATRSAGAGYVRAFPTGVGTPDASALNFDGRSDRANLAVVRLGSDRRITVRVDDAATDLVVDVVGAFAPGGGRVTAVEPHRAADTRSGTGVRAGRLFDGDVLTVPLRAVGAVPADAVGVVLNVTVTEADGAGYASVAAGGAPPPATSNLNYSGALDVPALVMTPLGADGSVAVRTHDAGAHVLVDVLAIVTAAT